MRVTPLALTKKGSVDSRLLFVREVRFVRPGRFSGTEARAAAEGSLFLLVELPCSHPAGSFELILFRPATFARKETPNESTNAPACIDWRTENDRKPVQQCAGLQSARLNYRVQTGPASVLKVLLSENQSFTAIEGAP
jgi:hypothetical protein